MKDVRGKMTFSKDNIRLMIIGAHPDDCEACAGIALKMKARGHSVKFLSATDGQSGHHEKMGGTLAQCRWKEAQKVAELAGVEYEFLPNKDGFLTTSLEERYKMITAIREWAPDVIITHRPNDYHPDHRNTSILVEDSSFLVQVPNVCPMTAPLRYMPVIFYMYDSFTRPYRFCPDHVFDITDVFEQKMRLYHQYTSQMYEWLPWVDGVYGDDTDKDHVVVPEGEEERFRWLLATRGEGLKCVADDCRDALIKKYGEQGRTCEYAEALEICEYGGHFTDEEFNKIFNF